MKKSFKNYLESIKTDDNKTIVEAFSAAFEGIFDSDVKNYLTIDGTVNGKPVSIEVTVTDVDISTTPGQRGYRDSLGAPEEPDEDTSHDLDGFECYAIATLYDEDGGLTDSKVKIAKDQFDKIMTDKVITTWKGTELQLNLLQYVEHVIEVNIDDWT